MIIIKNTFNFITKIDKNKLVYQDNSITVTSYNNIKLLSSSKIIIDDYNIIGQDLFIKMMDEYKIIVCGVINSVSFIKQ